MHTGKYEELAANENKKRAAKKNSSKKYFQQEKTKKFAVVGCSNEFRWIGTFHLAFVLLVLSTLTANY